MSSSMLFSTQFCEEESILGEFLQEVFHQQFCEEESILGEFLQEVFH